jgi:hypothetical protein
MPGRAIKKDMVNGKTQIIGNKRTEGHGLIPTGPNNNDIVHTVHPPITTTMSNNVSNNNASKFLKVLKPKSYINFD